MDGAAETGPGETGRRQPDPEDAGPEEAGAEEAGPAGAGPAMARPDAGPENAPPDRVVMRYRVDDALLYEAMVATGRALMRRPAGGAGARAGKVRALGFALGVLVAISALIDLVRFSLVGPELIYGVLGLVAGFAIYTMFLNRAYRRVARLMAGNPVYAGPVTAVLDTGGIEIRGQSSLSRLGWEAVDEVLELDSGALALVVPTEMLPLPAAGLPDGITLEDLKARIEAWRDAAAAAPE